MGKFQCTRQKNEPKTYNFIFLPDTGQGAWAFAVVVAFGHMLTQRIHFLPVLCIGSIEVCPLMQGHVADMLPFNWWFPTLKILMCYIF